MNAESGKKEAARAIISDAKKKLVQSLLSAAQILKNATQQPIERIFVCM